MKSVISFATVLLLTLRGYAQVNPHFETDTISTSNIVACSFISDDKGWLADDQENILKTTNGGAIWSTVPVELKFSKLDFIDELNGFGITSSATYKTIDGGSNWTILALPCENPKALYFLDSNNGFVSGDEVINRTTNGGVNWSSISTEGVSFTDFFFLNSTAGVAVAHDENNYQCIWRTEDAGSTWVNVFSEEDCFLNAVWFNSETAGWAVGYLLEPGNREIPVINKTVDAGLTWTRAYINVHAHDAGEALLDVRFKNEMEGLVTSGYSESLITNDGGETWQLTYDNAIQNLPSSGIYKTMGGYQNLFIAGRKGIVTTWK
jgi:photosystem II stability/assembly factor-like uncharacterized protein